MSLFDASEESNRQRAQPLAARMRPAALAEFVGQQHFLGEGKLLRRLLKADRLGSVIFYGPPGSGKTTLARLLAQESRSHFQQLSAVASGVKELREVLGEAYDRLSASGQKTLLFIDEIHRFNKAQQDVLLPAVEEGVVILVGATTENPFFTINSPLVSRSRIFQFEPLSNDDIKTLLAAGGGRCGARPGPAANPPPRRRPGVPGPDQRRRRPAGPLGAGGRRAVQRQTPWWSSPANWPKSRCSGRRCTTTARATPTMTSSAR